MKIINKSIVSIILALCLNLTAHANDLASANLSSVKDKIPEIDNFIEDVLARSKVPGLALVVIENNKPVLVKGYGYKEIGKQEPVDADTLFGIGSITKSMTTMLIAKKVDDGLFSWDTSAQSLYPGFTTLDTKRAQSITIEDLVGNGSGYTQRLIATLLTSEKQPAEKLFNTISNTAAKYKKEDKQYAYNNDFFAAAGFIVTRNKGKPSYKKYADSLKKEIFQPLGMKSTTAYIPEAWQNPNLAIGHRALNKSWGPTNANDMLWVHEIAPAGAVFSSANDMAKYLMFELNEGQYNGRQLISKENILYRRTADLKPGQASYELGWLVGRGNKSGLQIVLHGGGTYNYRSLIKFLPEKHTGVVILTNAGAHELNNIIYDKIFEIWFGSDEEIEATLKYITPPDLLSVTDSTFAPGTGMYQSLVKGYNLSNKQKKALNKVLGWHDCQYGKVNLFEEDSKYLFKGKNGSNIISSKKEGDLEDMIIAYDSDGIIKLKLKDNSFELDSEDDEFNYIFSKVRE
jgi:CubicO group peptidase (beta-lactamase class C family)